MKNGIGLAPGIIERFKKLDPASVSDAAGKPGSPLRGLLHIRPVNPGTSLCGQALFMEEVRQAPVSRGEIAKTLQRVSGALETPYYEAVENLRHKSILNIDETGPREKGKRFWTWVFRAGKYAVFHAVRKPFPVIPGPNRREVERPSGAISG